MIGADRSRRDRGELKAIEFAIKFIPSEPVGGACVESAQIAEREHKH